MKRAAGTFMITALATAIFVAGVAHPPFGFVLFGSLFFAGLWTMVDISFGHHFDAH